MQIRENFILVFYICLQVNLPPRLSMGFPAQMQYRIFIEAGTFVIDRFQYDKRPIFN